MAFVNVVSVDEKYPIELVIFSSTYRRVVDLFDMADHKYLTVSGKKDGKKVIVNKVRESRE